MQPASPFCSIMRFQLIFLFGSRSLLCSRPDQTSMIWPKRPSSMYLRMRWAAGRNGNSDEQATTTSGLAATAARISALACRSMPNGFSPSRCLPARMMST